MKVGYSADLSAVLMAESLADLLVETWVDLTAGGMAVQRVVKMVDWKAVMLVGMSADC